MHNHTPLPLFGLTLQPHQSSPLQSGGDQLRLLRQWSDSPSQGPEHGAHLAGLVCLREPLTVRMSGNFDQARLSEESVRADSRSAIAAANIQNSCTMESTMARINPTPLKMAATPTSSKAAPRPAAK